jgi:uncharacterized membrane protein
MTWFASTTTAVVVYVAAFFIWTGARLVGNFSANLKILRAYKFDE